MIRRAAVLAVLLAAGPAGAQLGPPPVPPQNPITESKRVLGKILFWDEQLSSDNTVACGTCHIPTSGGGDPRMNAVNPGPDGVIGTADDKRGSLGVIRSRSDGRYKPDEEFFLQRQVTPRGANSMIMAAYQQFLFWDGRARTQFVDPDSGATLITWGGALESQAIEPPNSTAEMAHEGRDWRAIAHKIRRDRPLALATNIPPDLHATLSTNPTYPMLFKAAFGDPDITATRIAFALATYQRTLVPNRTPFDLGTMTPAQQAGRNTFNTVGCNNCHTTPQFHFPDFFNIGIRPWQEDPGRMAVTGSLAERGRFKPPTLRNAGLKPDYMHNGQFRTLEEVVFFYGDSSQQFQDNLDTFLPIPLSATQRSNVVDFIRNGLLDPRVRDGLFPFDRPTLASERIGTSPALIGDGRPGAGGVTPWMIALDPSAIGSDAFRLGLDDALPGAEAFMAISDAPPLGGVLTPQSLVGPIVVESGPGGIGHATFAYPIPADALLAGTTRYF
ncbi:MAG: hypothetical protein IBJ10_03755, partial [Phycisphaerales bacterium]|nr:hypothetical protein [Phycisphaerales bacterium]